MTGDHSVPGLLIEGTVSHCSPYSAPPALTEVLGWGGGWPDWLAQALSGTQRLSKLLIRHLMDSEIVRILPEPGAACDVSQQRASADSG